MSVHIGMAWRSSHHVRARPTVLGKRQAVSSQHTTVTTQHCFMLGSSNPKRPLVISHRLAACPVSRYPLPSICLRSAIIWAMDLCLIARGWFGVQSSGSEMSGSRPRGVLLCNEHCEAACSLSDFLTACKLRRILHARFWHHVVLSAFTLGNSLTSIAQACRTCTSLRAPVLVLMRL
jgi:hypothetical protein